MKTIPACKYRDLRSTLRKFRGAPGLTQLAFTILLFPATVFAQLKIVPAKETPLVFGGKTQTIEIIFKNPTDKIIRTELRARLFQASSATLVPVGESKAWKQLQMFSGQSVIENIEIDFPAVRTLTEFRIRFSADEKQIADLKIRVAPDDLLHQFSSLTEKTPIGILDPDNQLKPLLKQNKVQFHELESGAGFDGFDGRLAIIGPFQSKESVPANLRKRVEARREKPLAIVWIQPPETKSDPLLPIYIVRENENTIVVARQDVVANLTESPKAQLNLLRAAQLALNPDSLQLPENETP